MTTHRPPNDDEMLAKLRAGELAGAKRLKLACGLAEFPREIFDLADTLEVLDLSGNALDRLPDDFSRLRHLKILFASDNRFREMPAVLGACPDLAMIGFKSNRIASIDAAAFPEKLRWLILTDNALERLPDAIGACGRLRKLMLAGNRLDRLPDAMAGCRALELVRLSANRFQEFPDWLFELPALAWLGLGGNPWCETRPATGLAELPWGALEPGLTLGEGASGVISEARWTRADGTRQPVAVKIFKGGMTSDGLPESEMEAWLAAGEHPSMIGVLARVTSHPGGGRGLAMPLIDPAFTRLAGPPSLESCTRDVYADERRFSLAEVARAAAGLAAAGAHLHARRILHGDWYGHNLLFRAGGDCVLGDFGAAAIYPDGARVERIEVRAFGCLLEELLDRTTDEVPAEWRDLQHRCLAPEVAERPDFVSIVEAIARFSLAPDAPKS